MEPGAGEDEVNVLVCVPGSEGDDWEVTVIVAIVDVLLACDCDWVDATADDVVKTGMGSSGMSVSSTNNVGCAGFSTVFIVVWAEAVDVVEHINSSGVRTTPKSIHMSCIAGRILFASA